MVENDRQQLLVLRRATEAGRYDEAARGLVQLIDQNTALQLEAAIELAETYICQGSINSAQAALSPYTVESVGDDQIRDDLLTTAAQTLHCFLLLLQSSKVHSVVKESSRLYRLSRFSCSDFQARRAQILIEVYHFRILRLAEFTRLPQYQVKDSQVMAGLVASFEYLIICRDYELALKVVRSLDENEETTQRLLARLIDLEDASDLVRAKARVSLSKSLKEQGNETAATQHLRIASPVLHGSHAHEGFDIDLNYVAEAAERSDYDGIPKLQEIKKTFIDMGYANGIMRVLYALSKVMRKVHNHQAQVSIEKEIEALSILTGTRIILLMSHAVALGARSLATGEDDLVRHSAKSLYEELKSTDLYYHQGLVARVIGDIYLRLGNDSSAEAWLKKSENDWSFCLGYDKAMAQSRLMSVDGLRLKQRGVDATSLAHFVQRVDNIVVEQCHLGHIDIALHALDVLLGVILQAQDVSLDIRVSQGRDALLSMERLLNDYAGPEKLTKVAAMLQSKANFMLMQRDQADACSMEHEALELLHQALAIHHGQAAGGLTYELINTRMQVGIIWHACFTKHRSDDHITAQQDLQNSLNVFTACYEGWKMFGSSSQTTESLYWIALLTYEARILGWCDSKTTMTRLSDAERGYDDRRLEVSLTRGLEGVKEKQALATDKHVQDVFRFGVQVCLLDRDDIAVWHWVQKAKARSLSDTLGLGAMVPAGLLQAIDENAEASALYKTEMNILKTIEASYATSKYYTRLELRKVQLSMRACEPLRELLDLRTGAAIELQQLRKAQSDPNSGLHQCNMAFVDYFIKSDEVYLVSIRAESDPVVRRVNVSLETVSSWVRQFLQTPDGRQTSIFMDDHHPAQPLRNLDCLIEFIPDIVPAGETIVFCPSGILNSLPVHALHIPPRVPEYKRQKPSLIERNPVLYSSSITAFMQCCRSAHSRLGSLNRAKSFTSVYEEVQDEIFDETERDAAYQDVEELAKAYSGSATTGYDVTPEKVKQLWPSSKLIYFHGHCKQSEASIIDQAIVLMTSEEDKGADDRSNLKEALLTVREFFEMKFDAPTVLLLACGSATQQISLGDEPLGLITALLCAGAASVVGTIWPVTSASARAFAKVFLDEYSKAQLSGNVSMFDLAKAIQAAVLALKFNPETRQPYYWAPYVLHGAWFAR